MRITPIYGSRPIWNPLGVVGGVPPFDSRPSYYVKPIVYLKTIRWGTVIAEHRLKWYSIRSRPFMEKTTNEKAFMKTIDNVAKGIVKFIKGPGSYIPAVEEGFY